MKNDNATTIALKGAQGSRFSLVKNEDGCVLKVRGGIGETAIPITLDGADRLEWESNHFNVMFVVSAIEALPDYAAPRFIVSEGHLLLSGEWEDKRGRAVIGKPRRVVFLIDSGI